MNGVMSGIGLPDDFAKAATVGFVILWRIEGQEGPVGGYVSTFVRIQSAFEQAGVRFLDNDAGGGVGVRLFLPKP